LLGHGESRTEFAQQGGARDDPPAAKLFCRFDFALGQQMVRLPTIAADCATDFLGTPKELVLCGT
jgi:hypothetical protein